MSEFGKVSWASAAPEEESPQEAQKPLPILETKGFSKSWDMRVLDNPAAYFAHFVVTKNGKPTKVNCTLDDSCPVPIEKTKTPCGGYQADKRFYIPVLDRKDNKIKVLDAGVQIVRGIGQLVEKKNWGSGEPLEVGGSVIHPLPYDICLNKGKDGSNPLYTVTPDAKGPLSEEDLQLIANWKNPDHEDYFDLDSRVTPYTADAINKFTKGGESSMTSSKRGSPTTSKGIIAPNKSQILKQVAPTPPREETKEEEFEINWDE